MAREPLLAEAVGEEFESRAAHPTPAYVPVIGRIAAGGPILAEQHVEEVFPPPPQLVGEGTRVLPKGARPSTVDPALPPGLPSPPLALLPSFSGPSPCTPASASRVSLPVVTLPRF